MSEIKKTREKIKQTGEDIKNAEAVNSALGMK